MGKMVRLVEVGLRFVDFDLQLAELRVEPRDVHLLRSSILHRLG